MAEYHQYCPVARAAEILADRWTPLIVRELLAGSCHFNEIERGLPGISRSLLASRLRHLEDAGVIARAPGPRRNASEYQLTEAGHDLRRVIETLGSWGVQWAFDEHPREEELDPVLLLWKMHQRIRRDLLPRGRTIVEFEFVGKKTRRLWLVVSRHETSLCLKPPGFDTDLVVRAETATLYRVWLGWVDFHAATRAGTITVEGSPALVTAFPRWLMLSPMAKFVGARGTAAAEAAALRVAGDGGA